jgi:polyhydroxybutyrate depolymerase
VEPVLGHADYSALTVAPACESGSRTGLPGATNALSTSRGVRFSVRTPANYDAAFPHPLLVVYAPAGLNRYRSEAFSGLTEEATRKGFILAYPDHRRLAMDNVKALGEIPSVIAERWCIDAERVYLIGHSDGGTASQAIVFLDSTPVRIAGIVASGAGIRGNDLEAYDCPNPLRVMIIHSLSDQLFPPPSYGQHAAEWWARCNRCGGLLAAPAFEECVEFQECTEGASTVYCETKGPHARWPDSINAALLGFLISTGE